MKMRFVIVTVMTYISSHEEKLSTHTHTERNHETLGALGCTQILSHLFCQKVIWIFLNNFWPLKNRTAGTILLACFCILQKLLAKYFAVSRKSSCSQCVFAHESEQILIFSIFKSYQFALFDVFLEPGDTHPGNCRFTAH